MKMSEAMFLGSKWGKQLFGSYRAGDDTCAIGAALMAIGMRDGIARMVAYKIWPWTIRKSLCPACNMRVEYSDVDIVIHLNDDHQWTRERIADWVAKVEPKEEEIQDGVESDRSTTTERDTVQTT